MKNLILILYKYQVSTFIVVVVVVGRSAGRRRRSVLRAPFATDFASADFASDD